MNWIVIGSLIIFFAIAIFALGIYGFFISKGNKNQNERESMNRKFKAVDLISRVVLGTVAVIYLVYIFYKN